MAGGRDRDDRRVRGVPVAVPVRLLVVDAARDVGPMGRPTQPSAAADEALPCSLMTFIAADECAWLATDTPTLTRSGFADLDCCIFHY
jgi:hypothetical protein